MKKIIFISISIASLLFLNAGKKQKTEIPPGTVVINDTLFADEAEVSNFAWNGFVQYNKKKYGANSKEYISSLPDTTVWEEKLRFGQPYMACYFSHPVYKDYPIVGVSYEQAVSFCKWRSERVNYWLSIKSKKQKYNLDSVYNGVFKYEYRLPTKQEWESFAMIGPTKIRVKTIHKDGKKKTKSWTDWRGCLSSDSSNYFNPWTVYGFYTNKLKMYNLFGNVSEMVLEKGIAKGGSFVNTEKEAFVLNDFPYSKPSANIGFRCVCVKRN